MDQKINKTELSILMERIARSKPSCGSCRFHSEPNRQLERECRKHSPDENTRRGNGHAFPITSEYDWCGEHEYEVHLIDYRTIWDRFSREFDSRMAGGRHLASFMDAAFAYFEKHKPAIEKFAKLRNDIQLEILMENTDEQDSHAG